VPLPSLGRRNGVGAPFPNPAAKQGDADAAVVPAPLLEQLDLHAIGPRQAPGGDRNPARQHDLERAFRRQLIQQRRLQRLKLDGILVREHDVVQGAHAVPEGADLTLPSSVFGPRDFPPLRRLASARALLIGTAARGAAPSSDMAGFLG
jgi:hypothetical protein